MVLPLRFLRLDWHEHENALAVWREIVGNLQPPDDPAERQASCTRHLHVRTETILTLKLGRER